MNLSPQKVSVLPPMNTYGWANSLIPRWTAYIFRPLGRVQEPAPGAGPETPPYQVFRESLWGTYGGWVGAALAFPVQTFLVFYGTSYYKGKGLGAVVAAVYALMLIPFWRLFVRRRDIFRQHLANMSDALRFLLNAGPAMRLQRQRRRFQRQARSLLSAYDRRAPPISVGASTPSPHTPPAS